MIKSEIKKCNITLTGWQERYFHFHQMRQKMYIITLQHTVIPEAKKLPKLPEEVKIQEVSLLGKAYEK